jgi:hypothetical protein
MLPAYRPNFAEVARTTKKVGHAWLTATNTAEKFSWEDDSLSPSHEIRSFIAMRTQARHWSLRWDTRSQSTPSYSIPIYVWIF